MSLSHGNLNYVNNFRLQIKWFFLQNRHTHCLQVVLFQWFPPEVQHCAAKMISTSLKCTLLSVTPFWHVMLALSRFFQLFMQGKLIVLWQCGSTCSRDKQLLNSQLDATLFTPKLKRNPISPWLERWQNSVFRFKICYWITPRSLKCTIFQQGKV